MIVWPKIVITLVQLQIASNIHGTSPKTHGKSDGDILTTDMHDDYHPINKTSWDKPNNSQKIRW
jgi:hypothetical protein